MGMTDIIKIVLVVFWENAKYFGYTYMYNIGENYLLTYSMDISC